MMEGSVVFKKLGESTEEKVETDGIGKLRRCRIKMEGKRRQKGKRLIISKKRVELTSKGGG